MKRKTERIKARKSTINEKKGDQLIDILSKGDHFGEIALISHLKRTCTVSASSYSLFLTLNKETFEKLGESHPESIERIYAHLKYYNDEEME